jgi:uncharacterized membrane protein (UPF0127 family)
MYLLVGLLLVAMAAYVILPMLSKTSNNTSRGISGTNSSAPASSEPASAKENIDFQKEGTLQFLKAGSDEIIKEIDIEVSDSDVERNQGLMYRQSMKDGEGMLFIFDKSERQSFWMKNTYISLDIIYLDASLKIVSIGKNTQPLSQNPVRSEGQAKYVVEVPGGFTDAYGIQNGDKISYQLD